MSVESPGYDAHDFFAAQKGIVAVITPADAYANTPIAPGRIYLCRTARRRTLPQIMRAVLLASCPVGPAQV